MNPGEGLAGVEVQVTVELSRGRPAAGDLARLGENDVLEIQPEGALIVSLMAAGRVFADAAGPPPDDPYAIAATQEGVPLALSVAIAGAESGYHPWALNVDGHEIYCHSQVEAERLLGTSDHLAIGLMQINWQFWGPRLGRTKAELLDPQTNLIYGARILRQGLQRNCSIWYRISNYHAGSLSERDQYNRLVYDRYTRYLQGETAR